MSTTFVLEGKSLKGKNRIREHGSVWIKVKNHDTDSNMVLVRSLGARDLRWIHLHNDVNFIVKVAG